MAKRMDTKYNTTVKLKDWYVNKIDEIRKDKDLNYQSRSDFVHKAVENELKNATILSDLNNEGKIFYEDILSQKRIEAYKEAREISENPLYMKAQDNRNIKLKKELKELKNK